MPLTQVSSRAIEDTLRYVLGASGTDHYTFTGKGLNGAVNDPTLTLSRGHTYIFENRNSSGAHPFYIKTSIANGGTNDAYNTGVTNNGGAGGTEIVFTVPHDAPDVLYYQCSSHINMAGQIKIAGAITDGSITTAKIANDAVTTAKIADSAVLTTKIADQNVTTAKIQNNAVTTAKIADSAVLTSKIAAQNITTPTIQDSAVTTAKINNGAVTNAKIDTMAASKLTGALPAIDGSNLTGIQGIPSGVIMMWSGAINAIPTGFVLCNGQNGTPTLIDRFIVGAGSVYSVGDTGGASSVTLSINEIPSHTHSFSYQIEGNGANASKPTRAQRQNSQVSEVNQNTAGTGGGGAHENRPPYYALCYIMKT